MDLDAAGTLHVSYSELKDFRACGKRFQYRHVDKIAPDEDPRTSFIGVVLQQVYQEFYRERWWADPATVGERMVHRAEALTTSVSAEKGVRWSSRSDLDEWRRRAREAAIRMLEAVKAERLLAPQVFIEMEMTIPFSEGEGLVHRTVVHGRADLVFVDAKEVVLLDAKAGGTVGRFADRDQLRLYRWGLYYHPAIRRMPDRTGFWWLRHGKVVWLRSSLKSQQSFYSGVRDTIALMQAAVFTPNPSLSRCAYCAYKKICPEGIETRRVRPSKVDFELGKDNRGSISL